MNVLIIDDDKTVCRSLERYVRIRGDHPLAVTDGHSGLRLLRDQPVDLLITDINMPDIDGIEILRRLHRNRPDLPVIVVTANANTDMAIEAVNQGAFAFLQQPILAQALNDKITEAFAQVHRRRETNDRLNNLEHPARSQRRQLEREQAFSSAILRHAPFPVCLHDDVGRIHMVPPPVPFELRGRRRLRDRRPRPGHPSSRPRRDHAPGGSQRHIPRQGIGCRRRQEQPQGLFEQSRGGTLFLDEVDDLSSAWQTKILHVIAERSIRRVGNRHDARRYRIRKYGIRRKAARAHHNRQPARAGTAL